VCCTSTADGFNSDAAFDKRVQDIVQFGAIGVTLEEIDARTNGSTTKVGFIHLIYYLFLFSADIKRNNNNKSTYCYNNANDC
jgi:hypothetical protein